MDGLQINAESTMCTKEELEAHGVPNKLHDEAPSLQDQSHMASSVPPGSLGKFTEPWEATVLTRQPDRRGGVENGLSTFKEVCIERSSTVGPRHNGSKGHVLGKHRKSVKMKNPLRKSSTASKIQAKWLQVCSLEASSRPFGSWGALRSPGRL